MTYGDPEGLHVAGTLVLEGDRTVRTRVEVETFLQQLEDAPDEHERRHRVEQIRRVLTELREALENHDSREAFKREFDSLKQSLVEEVEEVLEQEGTSRDRAMEEEFEEVMETRQLVFRWFETSDPEEASRYREELLE